MFFSIGLLILIVLIALKVAPPKLPSRSTRKRRKGRSEYDPFTWFSLIVVGVIFMVALNQYLADIHAAPGIHILAIAILIILLSLFVILVRKKRKAANGRGGVAPWQIMFQDNSQNALIFHS
jgi:energy-converting hydrogenase Eha subunit C